MICKKGHDQQEVKSSKVFQCWDLNMDPQFATLIYIIFIIYLFWTDRKISERHSNALWIPLAWMFLAGSRYVGEWINLAPPKTVSAYNDGSPVDAITFLLLITGGLYTFSRRKIDWNGLLNQNKWLCLYFIYCIMSVLWADNPFVSFKRWIKEIGNVVIILVILTEKDPYEAFGIILRRLSFLWLPLSVLFIKYYPYLGRSYASHSGIAMYTGITTQKNQLGAICLLSIIYYSWKYLLNRKDRFTFTNINSINDLILIGMALWLLDKADSSTSIACVVVALSLFLVSRLAFIAQRPGRIISIVTITCFIGLLIEATVGVKDSVIELLGRNTSLTERVPMWETLLAMAQNPIVGAGFQSFWIGERLEKIWSVLGVQFTQSHNGYIEQYLNLGYIGVVFIVIILIAGLLKVRRQVVVDYQAGILSFCFIITAALYNYTEASFYGINNIWLMTLFGIIEIPYKKEPGYPKEAIELLNKKWNGVSSPPWTNR
jgi:O-antigen ligase